MLSFFGIVTSPSSTDSSPTIMRKSVVFPEPFGPTRPTFSPGLSWNDASTNRICLPYCLLMRVNEIMGDQVYPLGAKRFRVAELADLERPALCANRAGIRARPIEARLEAGTRE